MVWGRTLAVLFVGFPNIPDNEVEVIQHHVAEIFIIADMGGLQHFQMGVIFAGAIPFNDFISHFPQSWKFLIFLPLIPTLWTYGTGHKKCSMIQVVHRWIIPIE